MAASKRVSTGIEGLDALIEQGFLQGRSYLVTGDVGTGKTTTCLQFLLKGLVDGEKAVYVTVDEKPSDILESAASLGWDLQPYIQDKRLVVLDASGYFSSRSGAAREREVDIQRIVTDLTGYISRMQAQRLAIDPVGPLIKSADGSSVRTEDQARLLIGLFQSQPQTTNLLSSHPMATRDQDRASAIEEFLATGVLALGLARLGERFVRTLWIKKMRGTAVEPNEYEFSITKGKGIVLMSEVFRRLDDSSRPLQAAEGSSAAKQSLPLKELLQPFEPSETPTQKRKS